MFFKKSLIINCNEYLILIRYSVFRCMCNYLDRQRKPQPNYSKTQHQESSSHYDLSTIQNAIFIQGLAYRVCTLLSITSVAQTILNSIWCANTIGVRVLHRRLHQSYLNSPKFHFFLHAVIRSLPVNYQVTFSFKLPGITVYM